MSTHPLRAAPVLPGSEAAPAPGPSAQDNERRRLDSHQIFGPAREVEIAHGDAIYRLRRTSLGKLILTK